LFARVKRGDDEEYGNEIKHPDPDSVTGFGLAVSFANVSGVAGVMNKLLERLDEVETDRDCPTKALTINPLFKRVMVPLDAVANGDIPEELSCS
jgi:hypothetical protein